MDFEEKQKELKKYCDALKGSRNEFESHVYWLVEVLEGSYCIPDSIEKSFWENAEIMLDDTLDTLRSRYEFKNVEVETLVSKE